MGVALPALPYDRPALEPHTVWHTMHLLHEKHHGTYVTNLTGAIEKHPELGSKSVEELLGDLSSVPDDVRTVLRNNGGGHLNHSIFWTIIGPNGGGEPTGAIADAINQAFGDFASYKDAASKAGI